VSTVGGGQVWGHTEWKSVVTPLMAFRWSGPDGQGRRVPAPVNARAQSLRSGSVINAWSTRHPLVTRYQ